MITQKEIIEKNVWDKLIQEFPDHTILQSWAWGEFRKTLGEKVLRLEFSNSKGVIVGAAQVTIEKNRYGKWMYTGYGPLTNWNKPHYKQILKSLKELGKKHNCDYLTIDPQLLAIDENKKKVNRRRVPRSTPAYSG